MIGFKVMVILLLFCFGVSVEGFVKYFICKTRWGNEENWEDCMRKTNTTKADITPWKVLIPIVNKPKNCLRYCVEEQLCPPFGIKRLPLILKKRLNRCTYDPKKESVPATSTAKPDAADKCEELWADEANWESCLIKTNATKDDITPWKPETEVETSVQVCLRLCVEEELCPPRGLGAVSFAIRKRLSGCTFEEGPIDKYDERNDDKAISTTVFPVLTSTAVPSRTTTPKDKSEASCEKRWAVEANWQSCMRKTKTTKKDITPWIVIIPIISKPRNCLRLCVEQELCPPRGIKAIKFEVRKRINRCTFDDAPIEPETTALPKMEDDKSASCKKRWTIASNWESCMVKTDTDEGDITPWILKKPIKSKPRYCLRLCVQQELCPPQGKESIERFVAKKRLNKCTFDGDPVQDDLTDEGPSEVTLPNTNQGEATTFEDDDANGDNATDAIATSENATNATATGGKCDCESPDE